MNRHALSSREQTPFLLRWGKDMSEGRPVSGRLRAKNSMRSQHEPALGRS